MQQQLSAPPEARPWQIVQQPRGRLVRAPHCGATDGDQMVRQFHDAGAGCGVAIYETRIRADLRRGIESRAHLLSYRLVGPDCATCRPRAPPARSRQSHWCLRCGAPTLAAALLCGQCLTAHLRDRAPPPARDAGWYA